MAGGGIRETPAPVVLEAPADVDNSTVVLFALEGREFTIPAKPRVNLALKYLRQARKVGEDMAAAGLLEDLLGEEAFEALTEWDDLQPEHLEAVLTAAVQHTLGVLEQTRGNGPSGQRK